MKLVFVFYMVYTVVAEDFAYSQNETQAESHSVEDYCRDFQAAKSSLEQIKKTTLIYDVLRLSLIPGRLVDVETNEIQILENHQFLPLTLDSDGNEDENIIFSIHPPEVLLQKVNLDEMRARDKILSHELKKMNAQLLKIAKQKTIEDCIQLSINQNFDFQHYMELGKEKNSLNLLAQYKEGEIANRVIVRAIRKLKLNWKVIESTDLNSVHLALKSLKLRNVVIISHAFENGRLVDSSLNEYPIGFFNDLSPSLKSISLFTCHAKEVSMRYRLNEKLMNTASFSNKRALFISRGAFLAGMSEIVPIRAFPRFMKHVESQIIEILNDENLSTDSLPFYLLPNQCSFLVKGFQSISGSFSLTLNGGFLGSLIGMNLDQSFVFPCNFLIKGNNILTIKGFGLLSAHDEMSADFNLYFNRNSDDLKISPELMTSKIKFYRNESNRITNGVLLFKNN